MRSRFSEMVSSRGLVSVAVLYGGKLSGILVTLLFLPIYGKSLSPADFGILGVILSIQTLLITLDFGLSTVTTREIAGGARVEPGGLGIVQRAEAGVSTLYAIATAVVALVALLTDFPGTSALVAIVSIALFLLLVLNNLYYTAIIASGSYVAASGIQIVANVLRAGTSAAVLVFISPTLEAFVITQFLGALAQVIVSRASCKSVIREELSYEGRDTAEVIREGLRLISNGRALALTSVAAAAVMQLDKPIIAFLTGPEAVAPYFLAMTFCLTPATILAAPLNQYFQPAILASSVDKPGSETERIARHFALALIALTLVPSAVLWVLKMPLITLWLGELAIVPRVIELTAVLLPGLAVGALGYLPMTLLLIRRDYRFQARLSVSLAALTLACVYYAASINSLLAACYVYVAFHVTSTALMWLRAVYLPETRVLARSTALIMFPAAAAVLSLLFL